MTTTNLYVVAEPLACAQPLKQPSQVEDRQRPVTRSKIETEPQTRLWKICAEVASARLTGVEWIGLLLLGVSALGALAYGFFELFNLFSSGALDQTVRALLTK